VEPNSDAQHRFAFVQPLFVFVLSKAVNALSWLEVVPGKRLLWTPCLCPKAAVSLTPGQGAAQQEGRATEGVKRGAQWVKGSLHLSGGGGEGGLGSQVSRLLFAPWRGVGWLESRRVTYSD